MVHPKYYLLPAGVVSTLKLSSTFCRWTCQVRRQKEPTQGELGSRARAGCIYPLHDAHCRLSRPPLAGRADAGCCRAWHGVAWGLHGSDRDHSHEQTLRSAHDTKQPQHESIRANHYLTEHDGRRRPRHGAFQITTNRFLHQTNLRSKYRKSETITQDSDPCTFTSKD